MTTASEKMSELSGRTRDTAQDVIDTVRDNPWPAVVVGAGLGYLLYRCCATSGRGRDAGYRYDERRTAARAFEADVPTV